ncbi:hypothetical protein OG21DRAFT_398123 [Imleria badia]|nr:hypothetical protein OG21DRAFT_398123 [Imleria badia]
MATVCCARGKLALLSFETSTSKIRRWKPLQIPEDHFLLLLIKSTFSPRSLPTRFWPERPGESGLGGDPSYFGTLLAFSDAAFVTMCTCTFTQKLLVQNCRVLGNWIRLHPHKTVCAN